MKYLFTLFFLLTSLWEASGKIRVDTQSFPGRIKIFVDLQLIEVGRSTDVDMLYVIDDSGSMATYQAKLSNHAVKIGQELDRLDNFYQAGVITTDMRDTSKVGRLQGPIIRPNSIDPIGMLSKHLLVGTLGSSEERPFDAILSALTPPLINTDNQGFLRKHANLYILVVSDAVDQSHINYPDFIQQLTQVKGDKSKIRMDGILYASQSRRDDPNCTPDETPITSPSNIESAVAEFGGTVFDICSDNYEKSISTLTEGLIHFLTQENTNPSVLRTKIEAVPFSAEPRLSTLTVQFGDQVIQPGSVEKGWVYHEGRHQLLLGRHIEWTPQPPGTQLEITYVPEEWAR